MKKLFRNLIRIITQWRVNTKKTNVPFKVSACINLVMSAEVQKEFRLLMDKTENRDMGELLRKALTLYEYSVDHVANGGKIIFRDEDGEEVIVDPILFNHERDDE